MKYTIEIYPITLDQSVIYIADNYPHSGIFESPTDTVNYYMVDKMMNSVLYVTKSAILYDAKPLKETTSGQITVDDALKLIAVAKDSRLIDKVVINPNLKD